MPEPYDAILVLSFGGPEKRDDVVPFLENVLRGRNVPRQRLLNVAEHYYLFDGISPINQQNRELVEALTKEIEVHGPHLPIYWGNRNWHPLLTDTLRQMKADGIRRAIAFFTSSFSSYSGCRQYREDVIKAQAEIGEGAPTVDKLRAFYNHPGFIEANADRVRTALQQIPPDRHATTQLVFTAHSIPISMATGSDYTKQLHEAIRMVVEQVGSFDAKLVYQSRSGQPSQPWLEPDVGDYLKTLKQEGKYSDVVLVPIGFISDHMEVLFDLDTEVRNRCDEIGLNMVRAGTVGTHPAMISMIRELLLERVEGEACRALGQFGPNHDVCPDDCCLSGRPRPLAPGS